MPHVEHIQCFIKDTFADVNPVPADTIGMSFMGVYFSEKGATSQLRSVYLIAQLLPATVVSA